MFFYQDSKADRDFTFSSDELQAKDNIIATPAKIGFLGLGIMGTGMVTNLLRSGHEVTVWNRTPSKVSLITAYNTSMLSMFLFF